MTPEPTRTRVVLRIAADPSSTALLLAGPEAVELWPGVRRAGRAGRLVSATAAAGPAATVEAGLPRRTPTSYVLDFTWRGPGLPPASGTLRLAYAPSASGPADTHAVLELACPDLDGSGVDGARLRALGDAFLANLARAAEGRADAA